jgi:hypothetical protein
MAAWKMPLISTLTTFAVTTAGRRSVRIAPHPALSPRGRGRSRTDRTDDPLLREGERAG